MLLSKYCAARDCGKIGHRDLHEKQKQTNKQKNTKQNLILTTRIYLSNLFFYYYLYYFFFLKTNPSALLNGLLNRTIYNNSYEKQFKGRI